MYIYIYMYIFLNGRPFVLLLLKLSKLNFGPYIGLVPCSPLNLILLGI
uniref:Uncharacterized protein n=1 Tax=Glossina morsitans morsitans TaxID=37546 RepID=A0A1B0FQ99_GLOMM